MFPLDKTYLFYKLYFKQLNLPLKVKMLISCKQLKQFVYEKSTFYWYYLTILQCLIKKIFYCFQVQYFQ